MSDPRLHSRDLSERVGADPRALRLFLAAYDGPWDAADALFWAGEPGSAAPSGRPDPSIAIIALELAAFQRPSSSDGIHSAAIQRWERSANEQRVNDAAVQRALRAALEPAVDVVGSEPARGRAPEPHSRWRRHRIVILASIAVIIVVSAAVRAAQPLPSLAIFERAQSTAEVALTIPAKMAPVPGTARLVHDSETVRVVVFETMMLFLRDGSHGGVCISLTINGGTGYDCDTFDRFRAVGVSGDFKSRGEIYSWNWGPTGDLVLTTATT